MLSRKLKIAERSQKIRHKNNGAVLSDVIDKSNAFKQEEKDKCKNYLRFGDDFDSNRHVLKFSFLSLGMTGVAKMPTADFFPQLKLGPEVLVVSKILVQRLIGVGCTILWNWPFRWRLRMTKSPGERRLDVLGRRRRRKGAFEEPSRRGPCRGGSHSCYTMRVRARPGTVSRRSSRCILDRWKIDWRLRLGMIAVGGNGVESRDDSIRIADGRDGLSITLAHGEKVSPHQEKTKAELKSKKGRRKHERVENVEEEREEGICGEKTIKKKRE